MKMYPCFLPSLSCLTGDEKTSLRQLCVQTLVFNLCHWYFGFLASRIRQAKDSYKVLGLSILHSFWFSNLIPGKGRNRRSNMWVVETTLIFMDLLLVLMILLLLFLNLIQLFYVGVFLILMRVFILKVGIFILIYWKINCILKMYLEMYFRIMGLFISA